MRGDLLDLLELPGDFALHPAVDRGVAKPESFGDQGDVTLGGYAWRERSARTYREPTPSPAREAAASPSLGHRDRPLKALGSMGAINRSTV